MIKSWTDADGVTRYADEHSKAYRKRVESAPDASTALSTGTAEEASEATREAKRK